MIPQNRLYLTVTNAAFNREKWDIALEARESHKYTFSKFHTPQLTRNPHASICTFRHIFGKGREGGWKAEKSEARDVTESQVGLPVTRNANTQEMSVD